MTADRRRRMWIAVVIGAVIPQAASASNPWRTPGPSAGGACPVTLPNGRRLPDALGGNHANDVLGTSLTRNGIVVFKPGGPGCVDPDGSLGMKWPWWRSERAPLTIGGRRLDGEAPPLKAHLPRGYGGKFQASGLLFPTPGCWEVTARVGEASLSFVTLVEKIGQGPAPPCERLFGGYRSPSTPTPGAAK